MEILDKKLNGFIGNQKKKKQIILTHTSRNADDYLIGLRYRYNKKYNKLPHYIITREGIVLQTMNDENYGKFFNNTTYDKNSIIISLENLGWLEKEPLKKHHINWIGSIYNEKVFDKKWRDYFFWEPYEKVQIDIVAKLCIDLSKKFKFDPICIGHNTKTKHMETFSGIISRSNIDEDATDLSPAFDFEYFIKKLENG
jgi:N-acetyl-anhydromuramyl-L-alanine amidase AmpD